MKELQQYTYTIPANGSVQIPAANDNFIIQASTGPLAVRGNTFGRLRGVVAGQGLKMVPFDRLELFDESGAPNTVTLLMTPAEFVNQTFSGSVTVVGALALDAATILSLTRPEAAGGSWTNVSVAAANTAIQMIAPAANVNGAIILTAGSTELQAGSVIACILAKTSAPGGVGDGEIIASTAFQASSGAGTYGGVELKAPVRLAAGLGLYYITNIAGSAAQLRHCRYILL